MAISKTGLALVNGTTYYISVFSENNAGLKSSVISSNGQTLNSVTGINSAASNVSFNVFPNPNNGTFSIVLQGNYGSYVLRLTNLLGQTIDTKEITNTVTDYTNQLPSGIYVLSIIEDNKTVATKKIVIN